MSRSSLLFPLQEKFRREFSVRLPCLRPLLGSGGGQAEGQTNTNADGGQHGTGGGLAPGLMHTTLAGSHTNLYVRASNTPRTSRVGATLLQVNHHANGRAAAAAPSERMNLLGRRQEPRKRCGSLTGQNGRLLPPRGLKKDVRLTSSTLELKANAEEGLNNGRASGC